MDFSQRPQTTTNNSSSGLLSRTSALETSSVKLDLNHGMYTSSNNNSRSPISYDSDEEDAEDDDEEDEIDIVSSDPRPRHHGLHHVTLR